MLETFTYCPTLYTRVAEMKALAQLPNETKDRIFPIIVARPLGNAKHLSRTWDKVAQAFGNRHFALDLDRTKEHSSNEKPAAQEFDDLFESRDGYSNYYNAVSGINGAIPVLRIEGGTALQFERQASHVDTLDRGVIVRIEYGSITNP